MREILNFIIPYDFQQKKKKLKITNERVCNNCLNFLLEVFNLKLKCVIFDLDINQKHR